MSQYGHTAWRTQDGFVNLPGAITQTTDGYIWIGVSPGILRFDGVKFTPWSPPSGQSLPSTGISYLLGSRDGSLWIGTYNGLARFKDGELFDYANHPGGPGISSIIEDHAGRIWVTRYRVRDGKGSLCQVAGNDLRCYGEKDGNPGKYGIGLTEDTDGKIWFGCQMLCRWATGTFSAHFREQLTKPAGDGVLEVVAGPSGSLWASLDGIGPGLGVRHYSNEKWSSYSVPGFNGDAVRSHTLFVDRDKTLWVGTDSEGLYHIHDGYADHYGSAEGLSGNSVASIYEDSEGNLWIATDKGLDLFRDSPVVTFSTSEELAGSNFTSVLALENGSVWVGSQGALDIIRGGRVSAMKAGHDLPGQNIDSMFEDHTGRVWLGVGTRLMTYEHAHFIEVKKSDGSPLGDIGGTAAITEDRDGNIWANVVSNFQRRLLRIRDERVQEEMPLDPAVGNAGFLAADRDSGIWMGDRSEKLVHYRKSGREVASLANGDKSFVNHSLVVASDNALWAATNKGLYRWKDGHASLLDSRNGLPCSNFLSAIVDNYGSLWINAACGILKIPSADLANWLRQPDSKVSVRVFDQFDGAHASGNALQPNAAKSPDGRLWFVGSMFVQVIDPNRSFVNPIPPPVHIEEIVADQKSYSPHADIRLAPGPHDIEIRYTALSFTLPQRVRFRYMLQGQDKGWQDPGTRREAFYSNLAPGPYRFHVIACNSDGIWNETGAELTFVVSPAYYQTWWFRTLFALAALAALWFLYLFRLRQATAQIQARLGERMDERERIARELHDTLLQGFQGLMLRFQAVMEEIPDNQPARSKMEKVLERADEVLLEGRDRVSKLRVEAKQGEDLSQAIAICGEELAREHSADFTMAIVGTPQPVDSVVLDDAYRIGREALVNAFRHSNASRIEGEITYDSVRLRLSIRDNGEGIHEEILKKGRSGHWGMSGMRERAHNIGGQLNIWSNHGAGTEVELIIPARVAYQRGARRLRWNWLKRVVSGGR
jgi:signal transduction histidine kinase/ligand-binding sensor domain-containing protein